MDRTTDPPPGARLVFAALTMASTSRVMIGDASGQHCLVVSFAADNLGSCPRARDRNRLIERLFELSVDAATACDDLFGPGEVLQLALARPVAGW
jgi:hypothetical protein